MNKNKYSYDESENDKWDKFGKGEFSLNIFNTINKTIYFF